MIDWINLTEPNQHIKQYYLYTVFNIIMINPVYFSIDQPNGSGRDIIIEPVLESDGSSLKDTGCYKLYKTSIDNQSSLFTEKLEINETNNDLADNDNPDYLGKIMLAEHGKWHYEGDLLSKEEQRQVAEYVTNTK
jgi:hypothetical protein